MSDQAFSSTAMNPTHHAVADNLGQEDLEAIRRLRDAYNEIKAQMAKVIVGQDQVIEELLIALFSKIGRAHV